MIVYVLESEVEVTREMMDWMASSTSWICSIISAASFLSSPEFVAPEEPAVEPEPVCPLEHESMMQPDWVLSLPEESLPDVSTPPASPAASPPMSPTSGAA